VAKKKRGHAGQGGRSAKILVLKPQTVPAGFVCSFEGCGRREYSGGLCQSHHRQSRAGQALIPVHPYHKRPEPTVKFSGMRLSPRCAERLEREARTKHLSNGALICEILELWCESHPEPEPAATHGERPSGPNRPKQG